VQQLRQPNTVETGIVGASIDMCTIYLGASQWEAAWGAFAMFLSRRFSRILPETIRVQPKVRSQCALR
jgi:hypothetical protein